MATQDWFVLTEAEAETALSFNANPPDGSEELSGRAIDAISPGVGLNLNPDATNYESGEAVSLSGKFVVPRKIVTQGQTIYSEAARSWLSTLPCATIDNDTIFAPPPDL
jgi:hypothetical protein